MSRKLSQQYSSVIVNQNQAVGDTAYSGGFSGYVQEFHLPPDYRRGTELGELRYPALSGIQLMVTVAPGCARWVAFDYEVQYQVFGLGWVTAAFGTTIGAPSQGLTWMTAAFHEPVEIDADKAEGRWRIRFGSGRPTAATLSRDEDVQYENGKALVFGTSIEVELIMGEPYHFTYDGLPAFLYLDPADGQVYFSYEQGLVQFMATTPNPLALPNFDRAYDHDGDLLADTAFNFRVLSLTAEEGVDFLGNQYRSVVAINQANNISTSMGGDPDTYWLSKPNPSKFAVESLYFDVRKPGSTTYGRRNMVKNPSFETGYTHWFDNETGAAWPSTITISDEWAVFSSKSAHWNGNSAGGVSFPGFQTDFIPIAPGKTYSARCSAKSVDLPTGSSDQVVMILRFWNSSNVAVGDSASYLANGLGEHTLSVSGVAPLTAAKVSIIVYTQSTAISTVDLYLDAVAMIEGPLSDLDYFDGDMEGFVWSDVAHGSDSFELIYPAAQDTSSVVDRVLIDPMTPGAYFAVYYTDEGNPADNEDGWDNKLWHRIPQTFRMERRETHVFPEPVRAKYIKIEFSHLQARHYAPGDFQQPIRYKKHPKWVLDYFLARMQTDASFMAQSVRVIHDAIDLAYNYYLDDLGQEPQTTIDVNSSMAVPLTSFLRDRTDASDRIDPVTLDKINMVLNPYRTHPALRGATQTLLGEYAAQTVDPNADYAIEGRRATTPTNPDVSTLNRDRVVLEQNYPVMFFYLTCRHKYREIEAKFTHDRAYFVGVRQIAFLRDNYMTAFDTGTYIEPAADTQNIERNEF